MRNELNNNNNNNNYYYYYYYYYLCRYYSYSVYSHNQ